MWLLEMRRRRKIRKEINYIKRFFEKYEERYNQKDLMEMSKKLKEVEHLLENGEIRELNQAAKDLIRSFEKKKRVGFYVIDWQSKDKAVFAHVDIDSKDKVGKYGVDTNALETVGIPAIEKAITDDEINIIIIDEIGKMEMLSERFCEIVIEALDSDKPIMVTLHKKSRSPLLQDVRRRDDIRILEVTPVNRNLLPYKIEKIMEEKLPPLF